MAGEAIISGVVAEMVGRALSPLAGHLLDQQPERSTEDKLPRLRHLLVRIESAAEAAGARRITSHALLAWLADLVDGACRGRYLLDALPSGDAGHGGKLVPARSFSLPSSFNPSKRIRVAARRLLLGDADELDGVLANLERVASGLTEFIMLLQMCPPAPHQPLPITGIYADSYMFGRHAERRRVLDFLLPQDDEGGTKPAVAELGILPIIGAAGLGRTTLVQHVCEDPAVRRRFSLVTMLDFHCMSLMATGETALFLRSLFAPSALSREDGGEKLSLLERKLRGERFLVVFDNVDARRRQVVDAIMPTLRRAGTRGSKVIVTSTDAESVAGLGTAEPIELRPLSREEYWFFFRAHAFGTGAAEADPRLVAAGQAIAKRLRGSFLGGKIVGALLRSRPDAGLWHSVLNSSSVSNVADVSCCLGNGGYVETMAGNLLPPHVTVSCVTVSGSPMEGHVGIQDSSLALHAPDDDGRQPELPVLLCKSVFPSYCLYYTAYCRIDKAGKQ